MLIVKVINQNDDLEPLVRDINKAQWDEANDIPFYRVDALRYYLSQQDTLFIACYKESGDQQTLMGIASSRFETKPYDKERWLYVDEVDVCVNQRQQGAGKAMMRKFFELADAAGCFEVWLGTEPDNTSAKALYNSLSPDEVAEFVGFNFERKKF